VADENPKVPGLRLPEDVPVRMMALTSLRYWGLTRAINRYLAMVRAAREATDARVDLERAKQRLHNLDKILEAERIKIELELADQELAREIAAFTKVSRLADAELLAERSTQRLEEFKARNNATQEGETDPAIAKLQGFLNRREALYKFLEKTKQEFVEARGGEENLTDHDREILSDLAEKIEQELTSSEDGRG
jgi:hypothetical protein